MMANRIIQAVSCLRFKSLKLSILLLITNFIASNPKKSCQGCELPSDDIPDSTSNVRGQNNNTPSATNNNQASEFIHFLGVSLDQNLTKTSYNLGVTPNSTVEYGPASSNSVNIISADSSVISSLDEDEEGSSNAKMTNNKKPKEETSSQQSIKREINVNKSIYIGGGNNNSTSINNSNNKSNNQGESVQSSFFQSGPVVGVGGATGKGTPPVFNRAQQYQLKTAKMSNVPGPEYLNNYYINRQEFAAANAKNESFGEFQKLVVRPQYTMQFSDQQKPEGKSLRTIYFNQSDSV